MCALLLAVACTSGGSGKKSAGGTLRILAGSELADMAPILTNYLITAGGYKEMLPLHAVPPWLPANTTTTTTTVTHPPNPPSGWNG